MTFEPTAPGTLNGELTVSTNAFGTPHLVTLTGTGLAPVVSLSVTSLTFGNQPVSTTSDAQTLTLTNTGDGPLTITSVAVSGDFSESDDCGASLPSGGSPASKGKRPSQRLWESGNPAGSSKLAPRASFPQPAAIAQSAPPAATTLARSSPETGQTLFCSFSQ